ncbi:MAG: hypothetical protein P8O70_05745 [SAR324 cluster bacterium]|nr:hypothetical protein [SAR324 cluster bacterium]
MLPAYQRYQEIELQRYFKNEYRDDWEFAMTQFVKVREERKSVSVRQFFLKGWQGLLGFAGIHKQYGIDHKHPQAV